MRHIIFYLLIALALLTVSCASAKKEKPLNAIDEKLNAVLFTAAARSSQPEVQKLIEKGANPEAIDEFGATPYLISALNGKIETVKYLVDVQKINRDITDFENANGMFMASYGGHLDVIKFLMQRHVNPNAQDINGITPFLIAAYKGHLEIVRYFLTLDRTMLKQVSARGANALIMACLGGNEEVIRYLIQQGMDVNYKDKYGNTPLILASFSSQPTIMSFLLDKGAKIDAQSKSGTNALVEAVRSGKVENVKTLLERNADVNIGFYTSQVDSKKILTALDLAILIKRQDMKKLLKSYNALTYDELDKIREL